MLRVVISLEKSSSAQLCLKTFAYFMSLTEGNESAYIPCVTSRVGESLSSSSVMTQEVIIAAKRDAIKMPAGSRFIVRILDFVLRFVWRRVNIKSAVRLFIIGENKVFLECLPTD